MIRVDRSRVEIPLALRQKSEKATQQLMEYFQEGDHQSRPPFVATIWKSYKQYLTELFSGKCAYCESPTQVVTHGDIEMFRPKSIYWWLAYEWDNLLFVCQICNQVYKAVQFPIAGNRATHPGGDLEAEYPLLLDPCRDEPEFYFRYHVDEALREVTVAPIVPDIELIRDHYKKFDRAAITIDTLGLNREELRRWRYELVAEPLNRYIHLLENVSGSAREIIVKAVRAMLRDDAPFAGMSRYLCGEFARHHGEFLADKPEISNVREQRDRNIVGGERQTKLDMPRPMYITGIKLRNFKCIKKLDLDIDPFISKGRLTGQDSRDGEDDAEELQASWRVILGDNAVGKTSILEAIALALAGKSKIDAVVPKLQARDFIRRGANQADVELKLQSAETPIIKLCIQKKQGFVFKKGGEEVNTILRGYGHVRLIPRQGEGLRSRESYRRIDNLFDPRTPLCDVDNLFGELKKLTPNPDANEITPFDEAARTIKDVLPQAKDRRLEFEDDELVLKSGDSGTPLHHLSTGYQSILVLAADIISGIPLEKVKDMQTEAGIILLDEIGSELHPSWRMRVVPDLRKAFPRFQFIATTHEPLCLRGVAIEETVILSSEGPTVFDAATGPDLKNMRVDQLLTSPLFGLHSTIDPEIHFEFQRYYELLRNENMKETEEIIRLRGRLSKHNTVGYTRRDQLLYDVIDKFIASHPDNHAQSDRLLDEPTRRRIQEMWLYARGRFEGDRK